MWSGRSLCSRLCCHKWGPRKRLTLTSNGWGDSDNQTQNVQSYTILPVSPAKAYYVEGTINGQATDFLVDTGAAVTLISKKLWCESTNGRLDNRRLTAVAGTPLKVEGWAITQLTIGPETVQHQVCVVDGLTTDAILGLDILEFQEYTIDAKHRLLHLNQQGTSVKLVSRKPQKSVIDVVIAV